MYARHGGIKYSLTVRLVRRATRTEIIAFNKSTSRFDVSIHYLCGPARMIDIFNVSMCIIRPTLDGSVFHSDRLGTIFIFSISFGTDHPHALPLNPPNRNKRSLPCGIYGRAHY